MDCFAALAMTWNCKHGFALSPRNAPNIRTLSIASLIAEAIGRTASEESVSSLFD